MKFLVLAVLTTFAFSCQHSVCECVEAGQKVNEISASFFDRKYSETGKDSLDHAIKNRDVICEPFRSMSAAELQEAASECENLTIQVD